MSDQFNDFLLLIAGESATGKSAALQNLKNPEGVLYLNCENNKKLPFKSKFRQATVTANTQIYRTFEDAESMPDVHTIIIDSLTFMMDMYETNEVIPAADGRSAWGDYAQYFKRLMSTYVASSTKNIIFTGHTMTIQDAQLNTSTMVKVKGSLMNNGIESFFSTVVATKKVSLTDLEPYGSPLLNITDMDRMLGFKYCFQTMLTKDTLHERIRSPMGMWDIKETFIDNDAQMVMDRLHSFYK